MRPSRVILIVLSLLLLPAVVGADNEGADAAGDGSGWVPIPVVFYTPETGVGGGASVIYFFRMPDSARESRPSRISAVAFYTQYHQYLVALSPELYFQDEIYLVRANLNYKKFPSNLYGLGNETRLEDEESYTPFEYEAKLELSRRWFGSFYGGLAYRYFRFHMEKIESGGRLDYDRVPGDDGGASSGLGLVVKWDTRDNVFAPYRGGFYEATVLFHHPAFGSDFVYHHFTFDIRRYFPFLNEHVLATQIWAKAITDDPPFYEMAEIGGAQALRGIYQTRYREHSAGIVQVEYRFPIWWRFRGGVFAGAGGVAERLNFLVASEFHYSLGGGLRFLLNEEERILLRVDFGVSEDDSGFYFVFGEAF